MNILAQEGVKPAEILKRLTEQFRETTLSRGSVFASHEQFIEGREHVKNDIHDRRLASANQTTTLMLTNYFLRVTGL